ncbi:NAD(P)/FAD-dependent oxidoreductase [Streptomyces sp. GMR22]|uniref:NAD(P)/FAD-dependent oxidoreductase n=1 Tax=Streptomyces sp. GMR22 TaxID=2759524 RepID=UPI0015FB33B6|nr:FAD-dependent oxidoreductase [Streptomyces sp. GMR22]MBA6440770.1 FAD-binding oxidoreductase [Streptomyces sp. GMR22]
MPEVPALDTADIVVVGGGIVGLCTAYELRKRGFDVVIVEQRFFAFGATGRNSGSLWLQVRRSGAELELARRGLARYAAYEEELGPSFEFRRAGGLFYYENGAQRAVLEEYVADRRNAGLDVSLLTPREAAKHSSVLPDSALGAVYCADDAQIDPQAFARGLGAACLRRGVRVYENTAVLGTLRRNGGTKGVRTVRGEIHAGGIVWATGAWSVALQSEGIDLPITTSRVGQLVTQPVTHAPGAVVHGPRGVSGCGALTDLPSYTPDVFAPPAPPGGDGFGYDDTLAQNAEGALLIGNSIDGTGSLNPHISMSATHAMVETTLERASGLGELGVTGLWAGLVGHTRDHLPIVDYIDGIFVNTGHAYGIATGPACGEILAQMIVDEPVPLRASLAAERPSLHAPDTGDDRTW